MMADAALYALLLILPVSALIARRLPVGAAVRMAAAWVAIFAVAFGLVLLWQTAAATGSALSSS